MLRAGAVGVSGIRVASREGRGGRTRVRWLVQVQDHEKQRSFTMNLSRLYQPVNRPNTTQFVRCIVKSVQGERKGAEGASAG